MPNTILSLLMRLIILIGGVGAVAACGQNEAAPRVEMTGEVNIYSSRHYDTDLALYENFTAATGIKVNRLESGADALIERIRNEGEYSPADLLVTVDAGRLWRAETADILSPVSSVALEERIPAHMRHPDGLWFGLSSRARIIIYNKQAGLPEGLASYEDLADPGLAGKICIRSSGNIYNISLLASIISHAGAQAAQNWAEGVVSNFARKPQGNDTSHIEDVASGACQISVVNSYYLARFASSDDPATRAIFDNIGILFPNQDGRGTHVNISGAGVLKHAPNRDNAIKFIEYLTEESAQTYFASGNNEYPAVASDTTPSPVELLGTFRQDELNVSQLGVHQAEAVRIFDAVGWP